jgi:hypothetical protein
MSSDEAADDAEHVSFIRMSADDTFDGKERVMSRAAWDIPVSRHISLRVLRSSGVRARRLS